MFGKLKEPFFHVSGMIENMIKDILNNFVVVYMLRALQQLVPKIKGEENLQ